MQIVREQPTHLIPIARWVELYLNPDSCSWLWHISLEDGTELESKVDDYKPTPHACFDDLTEYLLDYFVIADDDCLHMEYVSDVEFEVKIIKVE